MNPLVSAACGFALDLLLGDPGVLTPVHPVVIMGRVITRSERALRNAFPKTPAGERAAGRVLALSVPAGTWLLCTGSLGLLRRICPPLSSLQEVIWCWQALAVRNLRDEAEGVRRALETGTVEDARRAVGRIIGRDTERLDRDGIARAAVETVAENFSDGVIAPLLRMLSGGAPLALCYKAVNTLDSMVGYRNERYRDFGRASAKLDDAANFLPSRLSALLLVASAALCGEDAKGALRIWHRDRRKHPSPNSGQCEAAMAGALGLRLCGPAYYGGILHDKPEIGDPLRPIRPEDIRLACRMELVGSVLGLLLFGTARFGAEALSKTVGRPLIPAALKRQDFPLRKF